MEVSGVKRGTPDRDWPLLVAVPIVRCPCFFKIYGQTERKKGIYFKGPTLFFSRHDAFDNLVRIFFPFFCPVTAARFTDPEKPDCMVRAGFLNEHVTSFLLDLMQCSGAHLLSLAKLRDQPLL